ncbi:hypothetical protein WN55_08825 [Dufourea novaeangliae]|uniref:Uncharacterized protein n=1 Tax=Dufourea novaeangliae TaxID=178035 RepID=A0A154P1W1_DUFNO|nr:hypothetical protein WN55_08825 [Dufourea novaeangliae]
MSSSSDGDFLEVEEEKSAELEVYSGETAEKKLEGESRVPWAGKCIIKMSVHCASELCKWLLIYYIVAALLPTFAIRGLLS